MGEITGRLRVLLLGRAGNSSKPTFLQIFINVLLSIVCLARGSLIVQYNVHRYKKKHFHIDGKIN